RGEESMKKVAQDAAIKGIEISCSFDGSWMKKGFSSLIGLVYCVLMGTNKIIAIDVLSKYCPQCKGKEPCPIGEDCRINYRGSSSGMEPQGAVNIVGALFENFGLQVTEYLGDGDSKAFSLVHQTFTRT